MNADDLKKLTTESLKELAALLELGRSERLIALLKTMGRFHRYSLHNVCLIVAQRPSATRVAGFHTWRSVGRFVRKGEKGIAILAPIVRRRREETQEDESRVVVGFRTAYAFDGLSRDSGSRGPGGIRAEMLLLNAPSGVETGEGVTKQQAVLHEQRRVG
jgi:hypothetical protein